VEEKLDEIAMKKRKCEDLHKQYKRLRSFTSTPAKNVQSERETKLQQLETNIQETDSLIECTAKEKQVLSEACDKMQVFLEDTKGVLNHFKDASCSRKKEGINLYKWCTSVLSYAELHLVREHAISDTEVAFEYLNMPTMIPTCPRLVVTVTFAKRSRGEHPYSVISVKANVESLSISDLIDAAIERNDFVTMLNRIQTRWWEHIPLFNEIVQLRDKFAIDWLVDQRRLRLMLGHNGNIICTLGIPLTYPRSGEITLEQVNGVKLHHSLDSYRPKEDISISGWLSYLTTSF